MSRKARSHVLEGRTAGFITRMLAFLVDLAVVGGILAIGGLLAALFDTMLEELGIVLRIGASTVYVYLTPFIIGSYFVVMWSLVGRTIGKWFMGVRIVGVDGRPPTIGRSIVRFLGYGLSAIALWMGYIWIIVDDERRGWHDHLAKTWVVYEYERRKGGEVYRSFVERAES